MERLVLFDMDGTIYDTSSGIINSYKHIIKKYRLKEMNDDIIRGFIGQNLYSSIQNNFELSDEKTAKAIMEYRQRYKMYGVEELKPYDKLEYILNKLKTQGYKLGVATLKNEELAIDICKRQGTYKYFDVIKGMDYSESLSKSMIIDSCMRYCKINKSNTIMVGDSAGDMIGALDIGVSFIPVTYGYGLKNREFDVEDTFKACENLEQVFLTIVKSTN